MELHENWAATKLFRTSDRIGCENHIQTVVTMDLSLKTIEIYYKLPVMQHMLILKG